VKRTHWILRRICYKAEPTATSTNLRFVITNRAGRASEVFAFYNHRSECENRIEEFKNGFRAHRLSCHRLLANAFRLVGEAVEQHALYARWVRPLFSLAISASGSCGFAKSSFDPLLTRLRSSLASCSRVGVSIPDSFASLRRNSSYSSPVSRRSL
jgi:hypothetical protein